MKILSYYVKFLHLILFVTLPSLVFARTTNHSGSFAQSYYVDVLSGNDANTGLSENNAWQSLNKINTMQATLQPGDQVLFHKGQIFNGSLRLRASGISYGVYSDGAMPVINGFTAITGWLPIGGGIYEAPCNSGATLNMVTVNGLVTGMGRYPNADAPNAGYLTIDAHSGTSSISSNALPSSPVFTGAEAVIRKRHWVLDRCPIISQNNHTLTYITPTAFDAIDGFGFFIQNHPSTLDKMGEWWYDAANKKLRMYFGGSNPASFLVNAATIDTLINVSYGFDNQSTNDIIISGIGITGADSLAINVYYSHHLSLIDCSIDYTGSNAINSDNADRLIVTGCTINRSNNKGINTNYSNYINVDNTTVKNTGLIAGMGMSNNQNHTAIGLTCDRGCTVTNCRTDSSGYCGIAVTGDSFLVQHNFVTNFCMTVDDGGGIYNWGSDGRIGRRILNNIVIGGIGASAGTELKENSNAHGVNLDDRSVNVEIDGNSVAHINGSAITMHNSHQVEITNNTTYDAQLQLTLNHDNLEPDVPIRNVVVTNNILVAKTMQQYVLQNSSLSEDFASFGLLDNNYYCRPLDSLGLILNYYMGNVIGHDLSVWQNMYNHDQHSGNGFTMIPYKINSTGNNIVVNGNYDGNTNGTGCTSSPVSCAINWSAGHLDGGEMQVSSTGSDVLFTNIDLGQVIAGKDYLLRFSTLGTGRTLSVAATILHAGGAYENRSGGAYFPLTTTRSDNELLFHCNNSEPVFLVLKVYGLDAPYYTDNVQLREVSAAITNPDDSLRFVYNETMQTKSIALDGVYKDVKNVHYASSINLQPFSSAVLLKISPSAINQLPVANAGADTTIFLPINQVNLNGDSSSDPDGSIVSYNWNLVSGPGPFLFGNAYDSATVVSGLTEGTYFFKLTVKDNAGAEASDTIAIIVSSGLLPITETPTGTRPGNTVMSPFKVYPNPATSNITMQYMDANTGNLSTVIYNAAGSLVKQQVLQKNHDLLKATFEIGRLKPGLYYLVIETAKGNKLVKYFVKQ
jgi:Secretion system C-terminal sorting domain/PKD domain